jgi:hypothetical protein
LIASFRRATTCGDMPAGPNQPTQLSMSTPLTPCSPIVGRSGNSGLRLAPTTASIRIWPDLASITAAEDEANCMCTRPAMKSLETSLAPL